jgi:hypothetical protein
MSSRGNHRHKETHHDIDHRTSGNGPAGSKRCGGTHKKGHPWRTSRERCDEEGQVGKKATPAKKAPTGAKKATGARDGSKAAKILDLLRRPNGATTKELMKATGWQPHSIRGFLSGAIGKKMKLTVVSTKDEGGERNYAIKA